MTMSAQYVRQLQNHSSGDYIKRGTTRLTSIQFSKKQFDGLYSIRDQFPKEVDVIFRHQVQPWHPSSTLVHEAALACLRLRPDLFWEYSEFLFLFQTGFFDVNVADETRNQTYKRLARGYADIVTRSNSGSEHDAEAQKLYDLLAISNKPGKDGALNVGNKVTDDLKVLIKLGRQNGIHVSPTVLWDGVVENSVSSSWGENDWMNFFKNKL